MRPIMVRSALKVYYGPDERPEILRHPAAVETVSVSLQDILPVLAEAYAERRAWVEDFDQDLVTISTDLYEIILAYQHYRKPVA
ncbi:MAG: hypothetical protein QM811_30435 [Pirellulales bacterium]